MTNEVREPIKLGENEIPIVVIYGEIVPELYTRGLFRRGKGIKGTNRYGNVRAIHCPYCQTELFTVGVGTRVELYRVSSRPVTTDVIYHQCGCCGKPIAFKTIT